jgi:hypothetical protein
MQTASVKHTAILKYAPGKNRGAVLGPSLEHLAAWTVKTKCKRI